jgi:hypothetical protein
MLLVPSKGEKVQEVKGSVMEIKCSHSSTCWCDREALNDVYFACHSCVLSVSGSCLGRLVCQLALNQAVLLVFRCTISFHRSSI